MKCFYHNDADGDFIEIHVNYKDNIKIVKIDLQDENIIKDRKIYIG